MCSLVVAVFLLPCCVTACKSLPCRAILPASIPILVITSVNQRKRRAAGSAFRKEKK